ncbi:MAG: FG-GAP repeat protein [Planctomycetes bacterium]|nr:FG-GAP repeat protein [Planctomycetota bacterium]
MILVRHLTPLALLAAASPLAFAGGALVQEAYLKASDAHPEARFGASLAMDGETLVVGALAGAFAGDSAAYVFVHADGSWSEQALLTVHSSLDTNTFGSCVAISGDTVAVGRATRTLGPSLRAVGAVHVFRRTGTTWAEEAVLLAPNGQEFDQFGWAVALDGDTLAVSAFGEDSGLVGAPSDDSLPDAGAVYVFTRSGSAWTQQAYLKASTPGFGDRFGTSLALDGDTLLVGASEEDSAATGVNGAQADDTSRESGAAYVFTRSGATWTQQAYLKASNTGARDRFGCAVALQGELALIGAAGESSAATGVNGDQTSDAALYAGAAYLFRRAGGVWSQEAYLKAAQADMGDSFGWSVALDGDLLVVGAHNEDSQATGVGGNPLDNGAPSAGAVSTFVRSGATWMPDRYLKAANTQAENGFGSAVACAGARIVVGAWWEDGLGQGVDADPTQHTDQHVDAGAAYVFGEALPHRSFCFGDGSVHACPCANRGGAGEGCANSTGAGARLEPGGSSSVADDDLTFLAAGLPAGQPALLFVGTQTVLGGAGTVFGDGLRCAGGAVRRLGVAAADATGTVAWSALSSVQGRWSVGDLRRFQAWYRDSSGSPCGAGFNLTQGVDRVPAVRSRREARARRSRRQTSARPAPRTRSSGSSCSSRATQVGHGRS